MCSTSIFNRRTFMKSTAALAGLCFLQKTCPSVAAFEATQPIETMLSEFFQSFQSNDYLSWTDYFTDSVRAYYRNFASSPSNRANRLGLLDIDSAELVLAEQVDKNYSPKYVEFSKFFQSNTGYMCYRTVTKMKTSNRGYFGNGLNFNLILLIYENGKWGIGGICGCPSELCSIPPEIQSPRISYGMVNFEPQPSTLTVKNELGNIERVNFTTFQENVTYNEIGNMNYATDAIKANVMAIKMCGWWAHVAGYRASEGCDLKYGDVAYKSTYTKKSEITNAISSTKGNHIVSFDGKLFYTAYFAGSNNGDGQSSGQLRQNGSNYLARQGRNWKDIIHYYYDNSSYNNPNVHTVRIEG